MCSPIGGTCQQTSDCCNASCVNGFCIVQ
jgi:hypothetical protein